ncbi:MAG TPA: hypothetical protein VFB14_14075 [Bryobacteraceae bacterium]|jgi:hypothetical protein|nr:hypothetical protein [Bryobacteraceae bacterium]
MANNPVLLTPAAARQVLIGPDGRFTADGIRLLNALIAVAQQAAEAQGQSSGALQAANNLDDVASVVTARQNLGLGSAATHSTSDFDPSGAAAAAQAASLPASTVIPHNTNAVPHQFFTAYSSTTGQFTQAQPAANDISGLATVAASGSYTDLANKPTLPANTPAVSHQFLTGYNATTGAFTEAQPAFSDISGQIATSQVPTLNQNTTGTAANITGTCAIANGGTGATSASSALSNLGGASLTANNSFTGTLTVTNNSTRNVTFSAPGAPNDSAYYGLTLNVGSDGTLGALQCGFIGNPSATGTNRWVALSVGDSVAMRPLILNFNGAAAYGNVLIGTKTDSGDKLQVAGTVNATSLRIAQNFTGSGSAALGANCPAATPSAPYTWIKMTANDGSTVYVPAWK